MARKSILTMTQMLARSKAGTLASDNEDFGKKDQYALTAELLGDTELEDNVPEIAAIVSLNARVDELVAQSNAELSDSLSLGTTSTTALAGNTTTISNSQASAITANTSKTGITTSQASAITANTAKTGITTSQASAITANTAKTGITSTQASQITANNAKVGTETDLSVTEGMTLKATVTESRGSYTLVFTVTHGRVTKTAEITMS